MDPLVLREMAELAAVDLWVDTYGKVSAIDVDEVTALIENEMGHLFDDPNQFDHALHWAVKKLVTLAEMGTVKESK